MNTGIWVCLGICPYGAPLTVINEIVCRRYVPLRNSYFHYEWLVDADLSKKMKRPGTLMAGAAPTPAGEPMIFTTINHYAMRPYVGDVIVVDFASLSA